MWASCLLWLGWLVFSQDGLSRISHLVSLEEISERGTVSRYDLAYFLNIVDCKECSDPNKELSKKYDTAWREAAKADIDNFVDDVVPGDEEFGGKEYSVCVANVVDNNWMSWYPRTTSPFCPWRFCGANTLSFWEFSQTLVSFLWDDAYSLARIDRNKFVNWIDGSWVVLDSRSLEIVNNRIEVCGENACDISSQEEFGLYLRYCRNNLSECWMQWTDSLKQGDYGVSYANVLMDLWVLQSNDIQELWRFSPVPADLFLDVFDDLIQNSWCVWTNDSDLDGVENPFDNCPNDYNPLQSDQDQDGEGNVCDFDIDGDGIMNAPGVLDDRGNLRFELVWDSKDNCVIIVNPDQSDRDRDRIGDLCDTDEKSLAWGNLNKVLPEDRLTTWSLSINASVLQGSLPLLVDFEPNSDRVIEEVERYFWDGKRSNKITPEHIFDDAWVWTVRAVATFDDGSKAAAKQSINVVGDANSYIAFQAFSDVLEWNAPLEVSLEHIYQGDLDTVVWTIGEEQKAIQAGQEYPFTFETPGLYEVLAQWYRYNKIVASSRFSIDVLEEDQNLAETWRWAYLEATPLVVRQWENVDISTQIQWFSEDQVRLITWTISDQSFVNKLLTQSQRFVNQGPVTVLQKIEFTDNYPPLFQEMTLFVAPSEEAQQEVFGAKMIVDKELLQVAEELDVTIEVTWGSEQDIESIQRSAWSTKREGTELDEIFAFDASGSKRIAANIITTKKELIILEATVNVIGNELCVTNTGFCDLDQDNIIDMCDIDIDGDGVENMLGLVIGENEQCLFTPAVIDQEIIEEQIERIKNWEEIDNCPFRANEDQRDSDDDALGDLCDDSDEPRPEDSDEDGDGIKDDKDACPEIPENKNGIEDLDGCPEIWPGSGWSNAGDASAGNTNAWDSSAWNSSAGNTNAWDSSAWNSSAGNTNAWDSSAWNTNAWNTSAWNSGGWSASAGSASWWAPFVKAEDCIQCPCAKADFAAELMVWDRVKAVLVDPSEEIIYSHSSPRAIRVNE